MSPRAASRLERLGHPTVYDYAAGKVDWIAAGWPTIRADVTKARALDRADRGAPTCRPDAHVGAMSMGNRGIIVIDERRIVLGRVRPHPELPDVPAETIMEPGPTTVRAHEPLEPLLARMEQRNMDEIIVTTPEGELIGVVYRDEPT
jgi:CBS domain-containing protein